jgi:hypothetical protein
MGGAAAHGDRVYLDHTKGQRGIRMSPRTAHMTTKEAIDA